MVTKINAEIWLQKDKERFGYKKTQRDLVTKSHFSEIDKIPIETQPVVTKLPRGRINLIFTLPNIMELFVVGYKTG